MTLRRTGAGRTDIQQVGDMIKVLLYNFDFDGDEVKEKAHKEDLRKWIIPILRREQGLYVHVAGMASRVGNWGYNKALSIRRADKVHAFLRGEGIVEERFRSFEIEGWGEGRSDPDPTSDRDEDRSVFLVITRQPVPDSSIRPRMPSPRDDRDRLPRPRPVSRRFAVRLEGGSSLFGGQVLYFKFWDTDNGLVANYLYVGPGGLDFPPGAPGIPSIELVGPWNCFETPFPWRVEDLGGPASFQVISIGRPGSPSHYERKTFKLRMVRVEIHGFCTGSALSIPSGFTLPGPDGGLRKIGSVSSIRDARFGSTLCGSCLARSLHMRRQGGRAVDGGSTCDPEQDARRPPGRR